MTVAKIETTQNKDDQQERIIKAAQYYHSKGWVTVPMFFMDKKPLVKGHSTRTLDDVKLQKDFSRKSNLALAMGENSGGLVDIDFDCEEAKIAAQLLMPPTSMVFGHANNSRSHFIYQVEDCGKTKQFSSPSGMIMEYRSNGSITVFPPSVHKSGAQIEFVGANDVKPAPISREVLIKACERTASAALIAQNWHEGNRHYAALDLAAILCRAGWLEEDAEQFMKAICEVSDDEEYEDRLRCVHDCYANVERELVTTGIPSLEQKLGADVTKKVVEWLHLHDLKKPISSVDRRNSAAFSLPRGIEAGEDLGAAHIFKQQNDGRAMYCHARKLWYVWDEKRWSGDDQNKAHLLAYEVATDLVKEGVRTNDRDLQQWGKKLQSNRHIKGMLEVARDLMPVSPSELDQNPDLLCCENGTIDLRTGILLDHDPMHKITQMVPVTYDENARCERFEQFLGEILDEDLIPYIQRLSGYSLTGHTKEQGFYILYGKGRNGKSTLTSILQKIAGDCATTLNPEALLKNNKQALNDIAELEGKRLVLAQEINAGRALNEGLIKQMTGGEEVVGRLLYQNNAKFTPQCKIWLSVNDRPEIKGQDVGIWRRINLIPFTVTISEDKVDPDLVEKLEKEKEGILRWMVEGAVEWYQKGLNPPASVTSAIQEYRSEMDTVSRFISDCCVVHEDAYETSHDLFESYQGWSIEQGTKEVSKNEFGKQLSKLGYESKPKTIKKEKTRVRLGLKLIDDIYSVPF